MKRPLGLTLLVLLGTTPGATQQPPGGERQGPALAHEAVDREPRIVTQPRWPRALLEELRRRPTPWRRVTLFLRIDTLGRPTVVDAPYSRYQDSVAARLLIAVVKTWRFHPALRKGHPVTAFDTLHIQLPFWSRVPAPHGCLECSPRDGVTRWKVTTAPPSQAVCDSAAALLDHDSWGSQDLWIYEAVPRCPGAEEILSNFLRTRPPPTLWEVVGPARAALIASVTTPTVVRALMRSARDGHRYGLRFLPIALGLGFERVTDTTPGRWDTRRQAPQVSCGPMHMYLPLPGSRERKPDPRKVTMVLALADSLVADPSTSAPLRSTAWCLAAQLRE